MSRIRSIKPEWLDDERLATASSDARVLSIALILLADDFGNGRASSLILGSRVFPGAQPERLRDALEELERLSFARTYEADGQRYFNIRNWDKHQRIDNRGKAKVPPPLTTFAEFRGDSRNFAEGTNMVAATSAASTGDASANLGEIPLDRKGRDKKGGEEKSAPPLEDDDGEADRFTLNLASGVWCDAQRKKLGVKNPVALRGKRDARNLRDIIRACPDDWQGFMTWYVGCKDKYADQEGYPFAILASQAGRLLTKWQRTPVDDRPGARVVESYEEGLAREAARDAQYAAEAADPENQRKQEEFFARMRAQGMMP